MIGPTIGPIIEGIVIQFIAETRAARGKLRNSTRRPTGVIIAPPNPCTTRIAISTGRLSAMPHSAEPPAKISTAAQNTRRAPNRSAIQPLTGMNTAKLSRYAVITRLSRSGVSPRLFAIAGIATAIIVESSPSIKKAQPTISGMTMRSRGSAVVGNGAPVSLTQSSQNSFPRYDRRERSRRNERNATDAIGAGRRTQRRVGEADRRRLARGMGAVLSRALRQHGREFAAGLA